MADDRGILVLGGDGVGDAGRRNWSPWKPPGAETPVVIPCMTFQQLSGAPFPAAGKSTGISLLPDIRFALTAPPTDSIIECLAEVAQVVEHGTENAGVDSSSLSLGTFLFLDMSNLSKARIDSFDVRFGRRIDI